MSLDLPPDLQLIVSKHFALGNYASEEEVVREALQVLDEQQAQQRQAREQMQKFREGNRISIEQSKQGLSAPLDLDAVLQRVEERIAAQGSPK